MGLVREEELRGGQPRHTESEIARIISQVLDERKEKGEEQKDLAGMKEGIKELRQLLCDPKTGQCIVATRQEFVDWKIEERKRSQEKEEKEKLPKMTAEIRQGMQNSEIEDRDRKFARLVEGNGGTMVDSFRHVLSDPKSIPGMKREVLKMLKPEEIQDFISKCVVGPDGQVICNGLKGLRVQKQQDGKDNWETLGVPREQKKEKETAKHFW